MGNAEKAKQAPEGRAMDDLMREAEAHAGIESMDPAMKNHIRKLKGEYFSKEPSIISPDSPKVRRVINSDPTLKYPTGHATLEGGAKRLLIVNIGKGEYIAYEGEKKK